MAELVIACSIDRASLSADPYKLEDYEDVTDPTTWKARLISIGPGEKTNRQTWVWSPFVPGKFLTSSVQENREIKVSVRLYSDSMANLGQALVDLEQAVMDQFAYPFTYSATLDASTDGVVWQAFAGLSFSTGDSGVYNGPMYRQKIQEVSFLVPVLPIPISGGI